MNICAIFRNEALYLKEFLEFHLLVGVQRFYLYNNNSDDDYMAVLGPYIDRGVVELTEWSMPNPSQFAAYQDCIERHRGEPMWIAFIDIDEFLWSPTYSTVQEALESFPYKWGAVGVNWMTFGSSGKEEWEDAPVIERFTWRDFSTNPVNQHIKSIVWMFQDVIHVGGTPHHFHTSLGTFDEKGRRLNGPFTESHTSDILRINHYSSKSLGEWRKRILNGKPDRPGVEINEQAWYWDRQAREIDDREIHRFLPELKRRLGCPE